jgi:hypothetical protein
MIKVSSRFLAVLMLAVLAFTDVATTSAFAQRPFRFYHAQVPIRRSLTPKVPWDEPINRGHVLENLGLGSRSGETCNLACQANQLRDLPPQEENAQREGVLRRYRSPAPVWR